jgi:predicted secreted protein
LRRQDLLQRQALGEMKALRSHAHSIDTRPAGSSANSAPAPAIPGSTRPAPRPIVRGR